MTAGFGEQAEEKIPVLVFSPHPDDWQIFAGSAIYEHVRDRRARVSIVNLTAGDAGEHAYHWKSRHSGAVLSILRALPSWSPYTLGSFVADELPSRCGISHDRFVVNDKTVLRTRLYDEGGSAVVLYSLHLPDGGLGGKGYPPSYQSLVGLREGRGALTSLWPPDAASTYASWSDLTTTLRSLVAEACGAYLGPVRAYAPDPDPERNPEDHPDHRATAFALRDLCETAPFLRPVWMTMYATANQAENLEGAAGDAQRAAILAYGGGYACTAAGARTEWRRGWEREAEVFKNRQYLRVEESAG